MAGKESELVVAGKPIDNGLDVFLPLVDRGLDMVVQGKDGLYGIQVKSVKDYNRIVGLSTLPDFLIVHYRNTGTKRRSYFISQRIRLKNTGSQTPSGRMLY